MAILGSCASRLTDGPLVDIFNNRCLSPRYLEIILHAEHKVLLEELRSDYSLTHSLQDGSQLSTTSAATNSTKLGTARTERAQKHETVGEQADWPVDSLDMEDGSFKGAKQPLKVLTDLKANLKEKFMTALKPRRSRYDGNAGSGEEEDSSTPTSDVEVRLGTPLFSGFVLFISSCRHCCSK